MGSLLVEATSVVLVNGIGSSEGSGDSKGKVRLRGLVAHSREGELASIDRMLRQEHSPNGWAGCEVREETIGRGIRRAEVLIEQRELAADRKRKRGRCWAQRPTRKAMELSSKHDVGGVDNKY